MNRLILLAALVCGCGSAMPDDPVIDDALAPFLADYLAECESRPDCRAKPQYKLGSLVFRDDISEDSEVVGHCRVHYVGFSMRLLSLGHVGHVQIDTSGSSRLSDLRFRVLIYHELGHCIHGLDHDDSQPAIMNAYILDQNLLEEHWDHFMTQFMGPVDSNP